MIRYGKSTQNAIAAMSRLAAVHDDGRRLSSYEIADLTEVPQALTAKLLTQLSQAGLVSGARGPNGGYALNRTPGEITLLQIASVFERVDDRVSCPLGKGWCGNHKKCPLHDLLAELDQQTERLLHSTTLEGFQTGDHARHAFKR